jgi:hypothetical protein
MIKFGRPEWSGFGSDAVPSVGGPYLFYPGGEECLEERGFGFAGDDGGFDFREAGFFEEAVEFDFGEAEPDVSVEFAGLFLGVVEQVEDHNTASGSEDAVGCVDRALGSGCVVERLAE